MKKIIFIMMFIVMCLTGCGKNDEVQEGPITLTLAVFEESDMVKKQVKLFNDTHDDYQIEVKRYSRASDVLEDGRAKLQREIVSGNGPDIIDFGTEFKFSDITGGYTEDLLPYLEGEDYFENIVEAFCYQDKLYALPTFFRLNTCYGSESLLGKRDSWSVMEMLDCYGENRDKGEFFGGQTQSDILGLMLNSSMDYYIDWETGTCKFDGEEFGQLLEFSAEFPKLYGRDENVLYSQLCEEGKIFVQPLIIGDIYGISEPEYLFADASYIGYPIDGESGNIISLAGPMLSISSNSKHKEAAWEYISQYWEKECQKEYEFGLPVNKSALKELLAENAEVEYETTEEGTQEKVVKSRIYLYEEEPIPVYNIPKEQADKLLELIENARVCGTVDYPLQAALLEEAESYFSGDKSLEEVADVMQSRASIYVSERMGPVAEGAGEDDAEPVNKTVSYDGEAFRKSVFAAGEDKLYICGIKDDGTYFLGNMKAEDSKWQEFDITIPEDMRVFRMTVDSQGYCHVLWLSADNIVIDGQSMSQLSFEKSYISVITPEGVEEKQIDVSDVLCKEKIIPYCFVVDAEGNYYVDNLNQIVVLNEEGNAEDRIPCEGYVEGIGIGKSGELYVTYSTQEPKVFLGRAVKNEVKEVIELPLYGAAYSGICAGTEEELILYNRAGGIYCFETGTNELTQLMEAEKLPVEEQDISGTGFLEDGRLCLLENGEEKTVFHYLLIED